MKLYSILFCLLFASITNGQDAKAIIERSDKLVRGNTSQAEIKVSVIRPKWSKEMIIKSWTKGSDYAVSILKSPKKDQGIVFLKREKEVWNWMPSIERTIKLPPSMMMQSWMGTDLKNDDMVKQSSMVTDYDHALLGKETIDGLECYKLELVAHEDASVVWGKILIWIDVVDYLQLKSEFYDEDEFLVNKIHSTGIKTFGDRKLPSLIEFTNEDEPGNITKLEYLDMVFDIEIPDAYFTTRYMKRLK